MELKLDNFVYTTVLTDKFSFSLKGNLPACSDSIYLPTVERKAGWYFTLPGSFSWDVLEVVKSKLYSLSVSVSDALFLGAKRVLRRAVAGVRHFVRSNQGGMCRVAPMVPMALRL